jgi:hypothetical protein
MLEEGTLHLSGIALLAPHLDKLGARVRVNVLMRARHRSKRETKELIAELAPRPDVPWTMRKLPQKKPREPKSVNVR